MSGNHDSSESRRILERVERQTQMGENLVARGSKRLRDHLSAADVDQNDTIEVRGTRIGRWLAFIILVGFLVWAAWHVGWIS